MSLWGATPQEWAHFDLVLGWSDRLLPVVSNPEAVISPLSKMKGVGKTPSRYNAEREAAGIPKWTERAPPTPRELKTWPEEPDYGICVRTGGPSGLVAIDVDIDAPELALRVVELVEEHFGTLARRVREGSSKCLFVCFVEGDELYKRIVRVGDGQLVELLATGQQFVAAGTHTGGQRYEWAGGLPDAVPTVSRAALDLFWQELVAGFAIAPATDSAARRRGDSVATDDDRIDWLEAGWPNFGYGRDGQLFIECPWKEGHSSDSGDTETAYFPKGSGGYDQGHYKCLHASCAGRSDGDFDEATGYSASFLEELPMVVDDKGDPAEPARRPKGLTLVLNGQHKDKIEASLPNLQKVLTGPAWLGWDIALDTFSADVLISPHGRGEWREFKDTDYTRVRLYLEERGFAPVGKELIRDAVHFVAEGKQFDSAQIWIETLEWDGVPRVEGFLTHYFSAENSAYARAVSRYWWSAHAGRVLDPGCQCDMVPILVGDQGAGKSQAVKAMVPDPRQYIEVNLEHKDADLSRKMRGALIGELGELRGLQGRSAEANKAWVTSQWEEWTPKYFEYKARLPRRLVFVGTTNRDDFLGDATGERRWLPIRVGATSIKTIERDRLQLWAEAREIFRAEGIVWKPAFELAKDRHQEFKVVDIWEAAVARWVEEEGNTLDEKGNAEVVVTLEDVFFGAFGKSAGNAGRPDQMRMGEVLRALGFSRSDRRISGHVRKVWVARCRPCSSSVALVGQQG